MRWPWEFLVKTKATDTGENTQWTDPAKKEVEISRDRIARINKILAEARSAEVVIKTRR